MVHSKNIADARTRHARNARKASLHTIRIQLMNLRAAVQGLADAKTINHDEWEAIALPLAESYRQIENAAKY